MTRILGIFGHPLSHTLSPLMHNTAIKQCEIDFTYVPFEVSPVKLRNAVEGIRSLGLHGINVTIPHKESIIPYLDSLDLEAECIGAVNTICVNDGKLIGYNTDGAGFLESFKEELGSSPKGKNVLLFGAGGAARAIAVSLMLERVKKITIVNRNLERGETLIDDLKKNVKVDISLEPISLSGFCIDFIEEADILINTTSVGMNNTLPHLFDYEMISKRHVVCDIVYKPIQTELLKAAKKKGARTLNGLGMLIYQGALAFNLWTGCKMPVKEVKTTLMKKLHEVNNG